MDIDAIKAAEDLLRLRSIAEKDIRAYDSRLKDLSKKYKLDIDLMNNKVTYKSE
jgi:hypothetical protein